jgi:predicted nucleotidyltransferase
MRDAALVVEVAGVEVAIACVDDLLRMKRAAGRPRDIEDIAALSEVARRGDR